VADVIATATTATGIAFVAVRAGLELSMILNVTDLDPTVEAIPETTPVAALSVSPAGRAPEEIDQVIGATPPISASWVEYATPTTGLGTAVVVMAGPVTLIVNDLVAESAGLDESVTLTVNALLNAAVGIPEMTPVAEFRVRPGGGVPVEIDHVRGAVPPEVLSVAE
jgi:hypothetical protein